MPKLYKNACIQGTSSISTYTTLYNTTASSSAVLSTIAICNAASADATYRVGITDSATDPSLTTGQFIAYGSTVAGNDTTFISVGVALGNNKFIRVSSSSASVNFNAFISEIT